MIDRTQNSAELKCYKNAPFPALFNRVELMLANQWELARGEIGL
jgi:hypothetical protein